jgi:hypothetical protein
MLFTSIESFAHLLVLLALSAKKILYPKYSGQASSLLPVEMLIDNKQSHLATKQKSCRLGDH